MATEENKKMVDGWKADADGILIFTSIFSQFLCSCRIVDLSVHSGHSTEPTGHFQFIPHQYLSILADPASNILTSLPASPPPFSPPNYAVSVNTLLFLSLVISILCSARDVTQSRYIPHKRARIRAFFAEDVDNLKFLLLWAVKALPALLHVSSFLFLPPSLCSFDFQVMVSLIGIFTATSQFQAERYVPGAGSREVSVSVTWEDVNISMIDPDFSGFEHWAIDCVSRSAVLLAGKGVP
ncbi:hypothetical protein EDB83DRAFT_2525112 [Lactarius deliciosus]|nr:hypothetical protein EDB83DRAFT_2525112 [Lactarius deliciosus]